MSDSDRLVKLITKAKLGDRRDLAHLARVVSYNITVRKLEKRQRLEFLSLFRATAAQIPDKDEHTRIYFDALLEVVLAYWYALDDEVRKEDNAKYLLENQEKSGPILRALCGREPQSLDDLKKELVNPQTSEYDVVKNVHVLLSRKAVELLPGPGKYLMLSQLGEELVKMLTPKP